jgi:hypothetical protein
MPDSAAESQKHHLSKIRPHGLATAVLMALLRATIENLRTANMHPNFLPIMDGDLPRTLSIYGPYVHRYERLI